jgi:DNA-binding NarL/FixJ family response regulator
MSKKQLNIMMADDHQLILDGFVKILSGIKNIGNIVTVNSGLAAINHPALDEMNLLITDIEMPEMNGIDLLKYMKTNYPNIKILMLTMHNNSDFTKEIVKLNADGYVLKSANERELTAAIEVIISGKKYFSQEAMMEAVNTEISFSTTDDSLLKELTKREKEILRLIAQGFSNKQIAEKLFIGFKTVDTHRTNLMNKLDIHNVAGITRFAIQEKLI